MYVIFLGVLNTTLCDKVCQLFAAAGFWFYQLLPSSIFFNNKKYHYISKY